MLCQDRDFWKSEALAGSQRDVRGLEASDGGFCRNPGSQMLDTWRGYRQDDAKSFYLVLVNCIVVLVMDFDGNVMSSTEQGGSV